MLGKLWKKVINLFKRNKAWINHFKERLDAMNMNIATLSIKLEGYRKEQDDIKKVYIVHHDRIDEMGKKLDATIIVFRETIDYEKQLRKEQAIRLEKRTKQYAYTLVEELEKDTKEGIHVFTEALKIRMHALENLERRIVKQAEEQKASYESVKEKIETIENIGKVSKKMFNKYENKLHQEIIDCDLINRTAFRLASVETRITLLEAK